jgi:FKBP-type peptidyl-prolyl cis-trans isomerase
MIRVKTPRLLFAMVALLAMASCGDDGLGPNPEDAKFVATLGIDLGKMTRLSSGVYILTTTPGTGTATVTPSSSITAGYNGYLANGTLFDTGTIQAEPLADFVPGLAYGMVGMKVGEARTIVAPASLGYGDQKYGLIPANSVLVFKLTLLSIP